MPIPAERQATSREAPLYFSGFPAKTRIVPRRPRIVSTDLNGSPLKFGRPKMSANSPRSALI